MVTHSIDSVFKRAPPPPRRLDLDDMAERIAASLNCIAADWRDDVLGDAVAQLRRRNPELSELDIAGLVAAIRSKIDPGNFGRRGVLE